MFLVEIGISIVLSCILGSFIINKISTLQSYKKMRDGLFWVINDLMLGTFQLFNWSKKDNKKDVELLLLFKGL